MASQADLDRVLMSSARLWATLSTCSRLNVGCVIADRRGRIVSSGYNGAPAGDPHCNHACDCGERVVPVGIHNSTCNSQQACKVAAHSEANALQYAPEQVYFADGGYTMYCTHSPCLKCVGEILDHGIGRVVYSEPYRDTSPLDKLRGQGIVVHQHEGG